MFSRNEIPEEAQPVQDAQWILLFAMLLFILLSFVVEGIFSWLFPVSIPFAVYYAYVIHKTGYAVGRSCVYSRAEDPWIYKAHLVCVVGYVPLAVLAWLE